MEVTKPAPNPRLFCFASLLGCTPGFKKSRCKKLLKVTMSRIKLLRGRREVQVRQLRRDVAQLLQRGQEQNAQIRLDRLWKEQNLLSAYIKIGENCQLVKANLSNIGGQRECPMDLREPLASLCFAASCCADLPELQEIREIMVMKYGKDFLILAHELGPGCHVNKLFLETFSNKGPSEISKQALLKGISTEYNVVQGVKAQFSPPNGGLQTDTPSGFAGKSLAPGVADRISPRHGYGSSSSSSKRLPKSSSHEQDVLQEEKHHKPSKQTRSIATMPTDECALGFTGDHASFGPVDGLDQMKMPRRHRKGREHLHSEVDVMQGIPGQGGTIEADLGSREMLTGPQELSHGKPRKGRSKGRPKDVKKAHRREAGINNDDEYDGDESPSRDFNTQPSMHGYDGDESPSRDFNTHVTITNGKVRLERATKERTNGQSLMHGYGNGPLPEDIDTHMVQRERKHSLKIHPHEKAEMEAPCKSNGKSRSQRATDEVANGKPWMHECGNVPLPAENLNTHILQKGSKQSAVKKHQHEETQTEAFNKFNGRSVDGMLGPEGATIEAAVAHGQPFVHEYGNGNVSQLENHRERNHYLKKSHHEEAKFEIRLKSNGKPVDGEARPEGFTIEPCTDNGSLGEDHGTHTRQRESSHSWRKRHHLDAQTDVLNGIYVDGKSRQENTAAEAINGQLYVLGYGNGSYLSEDDKAHVMHREKRRFLKPHHQAEARTEAYGELNGSLDTVEVVNRHSHGNKSRQEDYTACIMQKEGKQPRTLKQPHNAEAKIEGSGSKDERDDAIRGQFLKPPQRPPPPVPAFLPQRSTTLEPTHTHLRQNQEFHAHSKLPEYEDLVASFAALKTKKSYP